VQVPILQVLKSVIKAIASEQFYDHGMASLQIDQLAHGLIGNEVLNALDF
jgi:hypothetical protein